MFNDTNDIESELEKNLEFIEETEEIEDIEESETSAVKKLKKKLQQCNEDKKQYLDDLQRAKADFLNSKRRLEEDKISERKRLTISYIENLLPLCDSFQMAMQDKELWEKADEKWRTGIEGIHNQLLKILSDYNVTKIESKDTPFNPHKHQAVSNVSVYTEKEHNKIQEVLQEGYVIGDDVIRHSTVVVGEYKE